MTENDARGAGAGDRAGDRLSPEETREAAHAYLRDQWLDLRNDCSRPMRTWTLGAVAMARELGLLSDDEADLWRRRIDTCPGHDDEGGRSWCAYCGATPRDDDDAERRGA